jgi:hypothetical protein
MTEPANIDWVLEGMAQVGAAFAWINRNSAIA